MKKLVIKIDGMSCEHCKAAVEKALMEISGVCEAKVDLGKKSADVKVSTEIPDEAFEAVIDDAGFKFLSVSEKHGLFG